MKLIPPEAWLAAADAYAKACRDGLRSLAAANRAYDKQYRLNELAKSGLKMPPAQRTAELPDLKSLKSPHA